MIAVSIQWKNQYGRFHRALLYNGDNFFDAEREAEHALLISEHAMYENPYDVTLHMINERGEYKNEFLNKFKDAKDE